MAVNYQKDFFGTLPNKSFQELKKNIGVEGFLEYHVVELTVICDG